MRDGRVPADIEKRVREIIYKTLGSSDPDSFKKDDLFILRGFRDGCKYRIALFQEDERKAERILKKMNGRLGYERRMKKIPADSLKPMEVAVNIVACEIVKGKEDISKGQRKISHITFILNKRKKKSKKMKKEQKEEDPLTFVSH